MLFIFLCVFFGAIQAQEKALLVTCDKKQNPTLYMNTQIILRSIFTHSYQPSTHLYAIQNIEKNTPIGALSGDIVNSFTETDKKQFNINFFGIKSENQKSGFMEESHKKRVILRLPINS